MPNFTKTCLAVACLCLLQVRAYTSGVPPVDRRAIAGLWRLTPSVLSMKEFTVHPRKPAPKEEDEVLLMLKEDGSFVRFQDSSIMEEDDEDDDKNGATSTKKEDLDQSWKQFRKDQDSDDETTTTPIGKPIESLFQGTWDYRDGELTLAADRDEKKARSDNYGCSRTPTPTTSTDDSSDRSSGGVDNSDKPAYPSPKQRHLFWKRGKDTILVGAVVATMNVQQQLVEPNNDEDTTPTDTKKQQPPPLPSPAVTSQQISVPMGSVQVGKFFYPKNHPSFFDQPIFHPTRFGTFHLKQVLRTKPPLPPNQDLVEKFRNKDFHNKRFFLTSHPIEPRRPKGETRWSIKYNKYVEDPPSKQAKAEADAEENRPAPIQVMEVLIHANNTFSTLAGLGDTNVLRGRFNIIGDKRDQVWMQSVRFGFGRSVSGSTYSEGIALGEEPKSFWGHIMHEEDDDHTNVTPPSGSGSDNVYPPAPSREDTKETDGENEKPKRLLVKGTVIVGWGLEPQPVADFIMREAEDSSQFSDDYDEEYDEEEEEEEDNSPDGWSSDNAFQ